MIANKAPRALRLGWACPNLDTLPAEALITLLDAVAAAGYEGIEPMIDRPYALPAPSLQRLLYPRGLRLVGLRTGGIVRERGLTLSARAPGKRACAVSALMEVIHFGARFGRPKVLVGLMQGRLEPDVSLEQALDWIAEGLRRAAQEAAGLGMEIYLEPVTRGELGYNGTVAEVLALIQRVGAPNVLLLVDSYHMHLGEDDLTGALSLAGPQIGHVHLSDSNRRAPGMGDLDFAGLLKTISGAGYHGVMTVECDDWPDPLTALRRAARHLSARAKEVR